MILLSDPPLARTLPSKRQATDQTQLLPFSKMSGNTYVTAVYASPPLNLRLSPGERGKETKVPVAFQRRLARAQCHVPYLEGPVIGS